MIPMMYEEGNIVDSACRPLAVGTADTGLYQYFQRWLLQKAISVFKWSMPEDWDTDYFMYTLFTRGTIAIIKTAEYGVIPQECAPAGYNVFYRPLKALVTNPVIDNGKAHEYVINKDCVVFKMTPDWRGIMDIVNYYATQMSLTAQGYSINMINTRLSYVFAADNATIGESMKKMADKIISGQPYVVADSKLFDTRTGKLKMELFEQNLSQNFIAPEILANLTKLSNMFATDIGIQNANTDKKERLLVDEVNANNGEVMTRADMWLDGWKKECGRAKKMFDVDISVDWRVKPDAPREDSNDDDSNT